MSCTKGGLGEGASRSDRMPSRESPEVALRKTGPIFRQRPYGAILRQSWAGSNGLSDHMTLGTPNRIRLDNSLHR